jgi:putative ABC transport system permease protein
MVDGNSSSFPHDPRSSRGARASIWESAWQDLKYAARGLRRKPGFAAAVVLTLGLGIGANATMFGIVDRLLFRPPTFMKSPDLVHRLYLGRTFDREGERLTSNISYLRYTQVTEWARTIDRTAAFFEPELAVGVGDAAREMRIGAVSASFWNLFDIRPEIGRFFTPDEDKTPEGTAVAVLSYGYWQTAQGGRTDVLGQQLNIGSKIYTIIGVAPKGFYGMGSQSPAAFIPITASAADMFGGPVSVSRSTPGRPNRYYDSHNMSWMEMLARRKPGVSIDAANADLTAAFRRSYEQQAAENPSMRPIGLAKPRALAAPVQRERGPNQGDDTKVASWLAGVAAMVLLIACANVANLLLARAIGRRREIAVRVALGVSRGRLLSQLIIESLLLAVLGAVAGLLIAQYGGGIMRKALLGSTESPNAFADSRVLVFTIAAAVVAGLLTGLAPALHSGTGSIAGALRAGSREGTYQRSRTRVALLVLQGALSVVLLVGSGLFVRSLQNINALDLGYNSEKILFVSLNMRNVKLEEAEASALRTRLMEKAQTLPFVENASRTVTIPFWMAITQDLYVAGIDSVSRLGTFFYHAVSPSYFETMGTRIVRGRGLQVGDNSKTAQRVVVVSQSMAKTLWPKQDAIGQCMKIGADTMPCAVVVGIAQDIKRGSLTKEEGLQYYLPTEQNRFAAGGLLVRVRGEATQYADQVRRGLQAEMPGASYVTITPLEEIVGAQRRSWTLGATMFTVFGGLALVLAAVGLYSVIAYNVAQRTQELGVRMALGAQQMNVARLILAEGLKLTIVGVAIGAMIAWAAGKQVGPLLYQVSPRDPAVFGLVVSVLLVTAVAACLLPARRAARVDPSVALRSD